MAKHFIAALGTSSYNACNYKLHDQPQVNTRFVQEALLTTLSFEEGDKATILLTDFAEKKNWVDNTYQAKDIENLQRFASVDEILPSIGDKKEGLQSIFKRKFSKINPNPVIIPDGKTVDEIWRTFEIVYEQIQENDTIYFDITNGFRSLPMLAMTILSYAKSLKKVQIKGIYYGALEAKDKNTGIVPIFDLTACNDIMDWTIAAENFNRYGSSEFIGELCKKSSDREFTKAWKKKLHKIVNLTKCIETSRGMQRDAKTNEKNSIQEAFHDFKDTELNIQNTNSVEKIVLPLYEKIEERASIFDKKSNFEIGMATVEWSIQNGMIQQGFTALLETMKTFLCDKYGIDQHLYETRDQVVANILNIVNDCYRELKYKINTVELRRQALETNEKYKDWFDGDNNDKKYENESKLLAYEIPETYVLLYNRIGEYRNDMNHFGFKKQPKNADSLEKILKNCYAEYCTIVNEYDKLKLK